MTWFKRFENGSNMKSKRIRIKDGNLLAHMGIHTNIYKTYEEDIEMKRNKRVW